MFSIGYISLLYVGILSPHYLHYVIRWRWINKSLKRLLRFSFFIMQIKTSSWLTNQIQHTRILKGLYHFMTTLRSCVPSISATRTRVTTTGKFLRPASESTEVTFELLDLHWISLFCAHNYSSLQTSSSWFLLHLYKQDRWTCWKCSVS